MFRAPRSFVRFLALFSPSLPHLPPFLLFFVGSIFRQRKRSFSSTNDGGDREKEVIVCASVNACRVSNTQHEQPKCSTYNRQESVTRRIAKNLTNVQCGRADVHLRALPCLLSWHRMSPCCSALMKMSQAKNKHGYVSCALLRDIWSFIFVLLKCSIKINNRSCNMTMLK